MKAYGKSIDNLHEVTFHFDKGEKCFCCTKKFDKKTKVVQSFKSKKEYDEYVSSCKYYYNIVVTNKNK